MKKFILFLLGSTLLFASCKKDNPPVLATITTTAATDVTGESAKSGGIITNNGNATITEAGICYSKTNATPTTADTKVVATVTTGTFTSDLTGLEPLTTYNVRAYATNSIGTAYGTTIIFTTGAETVTFTYNGVSLTYGVIKSSTTGKVWLDRNLGASNVASSLTDYTGYGDLFQWGRSADGHQLITRNSSSAATAVNSTISTLSSTDNPGNNNFIKATSDPYDWRSPQNNNLWQGISGTNNPCPAGYRLPTKAEFDAENIADGNSAFSKLKLTYGGQRVFDSGNFTDLGGAGYYWISSMNISYPTYQEAFVEYASGVFYQNDGRASACSVRCIKN